MAKTKKIYFQALETLKKEIINGKYSFRTKLPSEAELAADLKISGSTIRKVLTQLRNDGIIETRKGSGSYVCNTRVNQLIPVIICNANPDFRSDELLHGIQDFLEEIGLVSLPTFNKSNSENEMKFINSFIEKGHKNMIVFPLSSKSNASFYQSIMRKGVNLVFADTKPENITCDYVSSCNFLGGYKATKKLIDLGHTDIAFCCYNQPYKFNTLNDRFKGYLSALKQNGLPIKKENILFDARRNHRAAAEEFAKTTKVTAVFAATDEVAFALLDKFSKTDRTPAIIGFDNTTTSKNFSLASVNQEHYKMGKTAAELLYKRMLEPDKEFEHIYLPISVVERDSLYFDKINSKK